MKSISIKLFPNEKIIIHTDGGARGNPGPAAIGVVIGNKKYSERIGETTNNVAEYRAVIFALEKLKALVGAKKTKELEIEVLMDSELLAKQLNGQYKIKDSNLQMLFLKIWNLKVDFKETKFIYIPREQNKEADRLVNEALDKKSQNIPKLFI